MIQTVLVLLYLMLSSDGKPQVILEKHAMESPEACQAKGEQRIEKLLENEKFLVGLYAGCVPDTLVEIKEKR